MPGSCGITTGDAKAVTNGPAASLGPGEVDLLGHPRSGESPQHYPLCPPPGCWSSGSASSPAAGPAPAPTATTTIPAVAFPDPGTGACATGTVPIPRLRITVSYRVPPGRSFAVDNFPEQRRKAVTDHFDFENLGAGPPADGPGRRLHQPSGRTC